MIMSRKKRGTIESRRVTDNHFAVIVFIEECQLTKPSPPIPAEVLNPCIAKFSSQGRSVPVESASERNLMIHPVEDVEGIIAELRLERTAWNC